MGRYYYGDIEGKFAFGIQSSYDPEEFGTKALELYSWTCGCSSEKDIPSNCDCVTEGENVQETTCKTIKFVFDSSMISYIREKLIDIYENCYDPIIKDRFLDYISEELSGEIESKTYEELSKEFNTTVENVENQFKLYDRYTLGLEICEYIEENGSCIFFADVRDI